MHVQSPQTFDDGFFHLAWVMQTMYINNLFLFALQGHLGCFQLLTDSKEN